MNDTAPWQVFLDFDGTLTARDADFAIADAALPPERQGAYEPFAAAYESLTIGMKAYFEGYLEVLGLPPDEIARHAPDVPLRPGLPALLRLCDVHDARVLVLSEGLDLYVHPILRHAGLSDLPVTCNRAVYRDGTYDILPAADATPCERCLNCKGAHVRRAQAAGFRVASVGNGASDLCAAREADLVFARDTLLRYCREEGIAHTAWTELDDVTEGLRRVWERSDQR